MRTKSISCSAKASWYMKFKAISALLRNPQNMKLAYRKCRRDRMLILLHTHTQQTIWLPLPSAYRFRARVQCITDRGKRKFFSQFFFLIFRLPGRSPHEYGFKFIAWISHSVHTPKAACIPGLTFTHYKMTRFWMWVLIAQPNGWEKKNPSIGIWLFLHMHALKTSILFQWL